MQAASLGEAAHQEERGVDDAPRGVAAERGDQQLARGGAVALQLDPRPERERQHHDQTEEQLAESLAGIEVLHEAAIPAAGSRG